MPGANGHAEAHAVLLDLDVVRWLAERRLDDGRQTLELAATGNVEAAVVALSLVVDDRQGTFFEVDESQHGPIEQSLVVCTRGSNQAGGRAFAEYVNSAPGREVLARYGLALPGDPAAN